MSPALLPLLINTAPSIINALGDNFPKRQKKTLKKVTNSALAGGAVTTSVAAAGGALNTESALGTVLTFALAGVLPAEILSSTVFLLSGALTFGLGSLATYVAGYSTNEDPDTLAANLVAAANREAPVDITQSPYKDV